MHARRAHPADRAYAGGLCAQGTPAGRAPAERNTTESVDVRRSRPTRFRRTHFRRTRPAERAPARWLRAQRPSAERACRSVHRTDERTTTGARAVICGRRSVPRSIFAPPVSCAPRGAAEAQRAEPAGGPGALRRHAEDLIEHARAGRG
jgi:hypothetical protein